MALSYKEVTISGGPPWGFRFTGGVDQGNCLKIIRVSELF